MKKSTIATVIAAVFLFASAINLSAKTIDYYNIDGTHTRVEYKTDWEGNTTVRAYEVKETSIIASLIGGLFKIMLGAPASAR